MTCGADADAGAPRAVSMKVHDGPEAVWRVYAWHGSWPSCSPQTRESSSSAPPRLDTCSHPQTLRDSIPTLPITDMIQCTRSPKASLYEHHRSISDLKQIGGKRYDADTDTRDHRHHAAGHGLCAGGANRRRGGCSTSRRGVSHRHAQGRPR